ncbi:cyclic nucleotide-binding protein [Pedobacter yulinensis]|uniref:Cyclic nucleotide-binding protein n=1 Tax=Pedobacter yulinensis TaxID=2126353 RepID=A0A2T3HLG6_9SPHI|nr:Crp/Fnr family transcriptional regulator [Pedobacter yulinensis]PST83274.1 cyclic nucleotide-binding protein [Pedobacter yulinensis]
MHDAFFRYLTKFVSDPLSDEEKALIKRTFVPHRLRKRQFLLQAGDHCRHFAFIVKGAMRMYSVDEKGAEHIVRLGIEDWWMGDRESFVYATPSPYHIEACEHCELLLITKASVDELQEKLPAYREMRLRLDERNIMANNRRLTSAISSPADKRYAEFAACYPELIERFPQHIIASYIGINKDTLSRVKRQHNLK